MHQPGTSGLTIRGTEDEAEAQRGIDPYLVALF